MPAPWGGGGTSASRVRWRIVSWFDSTQVGGAPTAPKASMESSMTVAQAPRVPWRLEVDEVERLVHLVGPHEARHLLERLHPRLGAQHPVAVVLVEHVCASGGRSRARAPGRSNGDSIEPAASSSSSTSGQSRRLRVAVRHVDAEAVDAAVEPEAQHVDEHVADRGVVPVEVGLRACRTGAGTTGRPARGSRRGRRRRSASCWAAARRHRPCRRGRCSARGPRCRGRRRAPPGTTGARSRSGSARGRRSPAGRGRAPSSSIRSKSSRVPKSGSTSQ